MEELIRFSKSLKKNFKPKIKDPSKLVSCWSENDSYEGKIVKAFVLIFRTRGCSWAINSGCTMCGYFNDSIWKKVSNNDILNQFNDAMEKYSGEKIVKIFTSGSFLDDKEITKKTRNNILNKIVERVDKISIESRPEYITENKLKDIKKILGAKKFEIGIGLETSNDLIREHAINKGFTFNDYKNAADILKNRF